MEIFFKPDARRSQVRRVAALILWKCGKETREKRAMESLKKGVARHLEPVDVTELYHVILYCVIL